MDILSLAGTVVRRWYVSGPILLLTIALAVVVQLNVPARYQASGSVLLAGPTLEPARLPLTERTVDNALSQVRSRLDAGELLPESAWVEIQRLDVTSLEARIGGDTGQAVQESLAATVDALQAELDAIQEANGIVEEERTDVFVASTEVLAQADEDTAAEDIVFEAPVVATSTVSLIDPTSGFDNPFGASATSVRVLEVTLESDEGEQALTQRAGHEVDFDISQNDNDVAPIMEVTAFSETREGALADFEVVVAALSEELDDRQARAQVPQARRVVLEPLAEPLEVEDVSPPVDRLTVLVIGLGGLLALGVALLVDVVAARRADRRVPGEQSQIRPEADDEADETAATGEPAPSR